MGTYCGTNCAECDFQANCCGCAETCGQPFGGRCVAAEYIKVGGLQRFKEFKLQIMGEFNGLGFPGMSKISELYCVPGSFVNLEYPLPNGTAVKLLDDKNIYLGTQVEMPNDRCYGLVADMGFLLVCEYGCNGENPELILYMRR